MLLEFRIENYLSFKERAKLSMLASSSISKNELEEAVFAVDKYNILKSVAVYGANASGKSNLVKAIGFMSEFIFNSAKESTFGKNIDVNNFKLSEESVNKPATFEITFILRDFIYDSECRNTVFRYGFQVDRTMVKAEWLFARFTAKETTLFTRIKDDIKTGGKFREGDRVYKTLGSINKSTLFLSQIAQIKGENAPITFGIMDWFASLRDISGIADNNFYPVTVNIMKNEKYRAKVVKALMLADMCIEDITVKEQKMDYEKLPEEVKSKIRDSDAKNITSMTLDTLHRVYNQEKKEIRKVVFNFENEESDGSKKFFAIIGPVISALDNGYVLVIDELDARLHPKLCLLVVSLFNSQKINRKGAQLIFTAHNTLIMDKRKLRRDQIYLVEKDKYGASELYSLLDYVKVRNDASYSKDYLMGKYGAVPYLGNFETLFD
jgi:uncharacterized protein